MNIEDFREFCLTVKGAEECFPFDETTLVFKVMGKMFTYISLEPKGGEFFANMKCDPDRAVDLREHYEGVGPGYHTTKKMWNSVYLEKDVPDNLIKELVLHSVDEVIKKLPKKYQAEYAAMRNE